jgi:hypothetical protein
MPRCSQALVDICPACCRRSGSSSSRTATSPASRVRSCWCSAPSSSPSSPTSSCESPCRAGMVACLLRSSAGSGRAVALQIQIPPNSSCWFCSHHRWCCTVVPDLCSAWHCEIWFVSVTASSLSCYCVSLGPGCKAQLVQAARCMCPASMCKLLNVGSSALKGGAQRLSATVRGLCSHWMLEISLLCVG